jgi:hypothetical protein
MKIDDVVVDQIDTVGDLMRVVGSVDNDRSDRYPTHPRGDFG